MSPLGLNEERPYDTSALIEFRFITRYPLCISHKLPVQCLHLGFHGTLSSLQFHQLSLHDNKLISHTRGTIVDVQVCGDTDTGRKVKESVAAERLIQDSSEKTAVYDTVVTAECSTKMDDGYNKRLFVSKSSTTTIQWVDENTPTASDSSFLAKRTGGIASLPGPRRVPAVSELWTF